jgi:HSP20 family molecular chaperone IbpA
MENAGVQKKQTGETASVFSTVWDPFWFMRQVFGWGRSGDAPSFDVKETDDTYVCKVNVKLTLPDHADVAHAKAELDNGELTLVVPKVVAATPEPVAPPQRTPRAKGKGGGSAGRRPRRGARTRARRG